MAINRENLGTTTRRPLPPVEPRATVASRELADSEARGETNGRGAGREQSAGMKSTA
jgi:hypothetical protein